MTEIAEARWVDPKSPGAHRDGLVLRERDDLTRELVLQRQNVVGRHEGMVA